MPKRRAFDKDRRARNLEALALSGAKMATRKTPRVFAGMRKAAGWLGLGRGRGSGRGLGLALVWLGLLGGPALAAPEGKKAQAPSIERFGSAAQALGRLLQGRPRVVAFGEFHELKDAPRVPSALRRFTEELLPVLAPHASDLVVETFVASGRCGEPEQSAVAAIEATTKRPASTENELVTLLKAAKAADVAPHILKVSCADYEALQSAGKALDVEQLLRLIKTHTESEITRVLRGPSSRKRMVASYGGALHNDLYPDKLLRSFSYGASLERLTGGRYLEVDLYVPEYIERDEQLRAEAWYPRYLKAAQAGGTVLVRRGPGSFIIVFPRTLPLAPGPG